MGTRILAALSRARPALTAGLLALGVSGCSATPRSPLAPGPRPSTPAPVLAIPPSQPAVAPSPPSVAGRLKVALVASRVWMDGEYVGRLDRLDYVRLLARVRDRRAAAGAPAEAKTVELEVDASTDWRNAHHSFELFEDYERVELTTAAGRFSLGIDSGRDVAPESTSERRTAVFVRRDSVALWAGPVVDSDASSGAEPQPEKLLEVARSGALDELDTELQRACSTGSRCARLVVHFEEGLHGRELVRLLQSLQRAPGSSAAPPDIRLALTTPPPLGEEATAFIRRDPASGRLPVVVIRQVVRGSYGFFLACFEGALSRHAKLAGRLTLRFAIERDGSVDHVVNGGGDLPDEEATQCLIQGFRGLHFPAPNGGMMTVQYPILLRPR